MTTIITRASLRSAGACYDDDRIADIVPSEGLSPAQVAALAIPAEDRHWALCRAAGADDATLRQHACWCARRALARAAAPDPRSVAAVETAERYVAGAASEAEMRAAWAAVWAAVAAARAAARAAVAAAGGAAWAAWAAARAAWGAARDAAAEAARDAAAEAAWAAGIGAMDVERAAQIADLVARLEEVQR